ncbi:MAG: hypothetical protein JSW52_09960, partial [Candidatus Coatesbacteria bacterium]
VAGDNEPLGPYEPVQFFYVYKKGNAEPDVVSTSVIDGFCAWEFAWSSGKLYAVANIGSETLQGDVLYEIDSVAGTVKGILSAHSIELPGEGERYAYYAELGPDNSIIVNNFEETGRYYVGYEFEPWQHFCSFYGHEIFGYSIPYRLDLNTGETEKLFNATATSTLTEPGKPADYLGADKAIDGDLSTAWVEGVDGSGVGETLTITFGAVIEVNFVDIFPGFGKSPDIYYGNNRIKKVRLEFSDGTSVTESFDDEAGRKTIVLYDRETWEGINSEWVKLTVLDVYKGLKWDDTAIGEVAINQEGKP